MPTTTLTLFQRIDNAIQTLANKVFYTTATKKLRTMRINSFEEFDHINAILGRQHVKVRCSQAEKFYLSPVFRQDNRAKNKFIEHVGADITHVLIYFNSI